MGKANIWRTVLLNWKNKWKSNNNLTSYFTKNIPRAFVAGCFFFLFLETNMANSCVSQRLLYFLINNMWHKSIYKKDKSCHSPNSLIIALALITAFSAYTLSPRKRHAFRCLQIPHKQMSGVVLLWADIYMAFCCRCSSSE